MDQGLTAIQGWRIDSLEHRETNLDSRSRLKQEALNKAEIARSYVDAIRDGDIVSNIRATEPYWEALIAVDRYVNYTIRLENHNQAFLRVAEGIARFIHVRSFQIVSAILSRKSGLPIRIPTVPEYLVQAASRGAPDFRGTPGP